MIKKIIALEGHLTQTNIKDIKHILNSSLPNTVFYYAKINEIDYQIKDEGNVSIDFVIETKGRRSIGSFTTLF